jgi:oxygen-dependent protoporphyrinogen oxidase
MIAVIGGGISGLVAAFRLRQRLGADVRIEVFEASDRVGGKLWTVDFGGKNYDVGAEAFLARRPEVPALAAELGIAEDIVYPNSAAGSRVRAGGALRKIPAGTIMGVPVSVDAVRDILSDEGIALLEAEKDLPPLTLPAEDVSLGLLLRQRLGDEIVDRLVDPLLSGVYAGRADALGLRATMPALAAALDKGHTTILSAAASLAPQPPSSGQVAGVRPPVFGAFSGGYQELLRELERQSGAVVHVGSPVTSLRDVDAEAFVVATPSPVSARLLAELAPEAAEAFARIEVANTALVCMAFPAETALPESSGVLIGTKETHADGTAFTAKAFTYSSRKWTHLADGNLVIRGSVGRAGDDVSWRRSDAELITAVRADLAELTGIVDAPLDVLVQRWPECLPQYGAGHVELVAELEKSVGKVPNVAVAGASLYGVGVPACVATATAAANKIADFVLGKEK